MLKRFADRTPDVVRYFVILSKFDEPSIDQVVDNYNEKEYTFIDLFAGIGGFHQAMKSFGGKCVFACDIDQDCRKTYEINYGIKPAGDITQIQASAIPPHDILFAGFPCQSFSKAGKD